MKRNYKIEKIKSCTNLPLISDEIIKHIVIDYDIGKIYFKGILIKEHFYLITYYKEKTCEYGYSSWSYNSIRDDDAQDLIIARIDRNNKLTITDKLSFISELVGYDKY